FHPNVVAPLDVVSTDGELFLVMEYVRGASLSRLLRSALAGEELAPPRIVSAVIGGLLYGLHAAHEARGDRGEALDIVHRDVSPQNVLVGVDGVSRVLDFGVAKAAGRMQTTRDGQLKGKLAYMGPEQVKGEAVTRRTDIYAATVVLWEALTGRRLFKAENEANAIAKVLAGRVPAASSIVPGLSPEVDAVIARGIHLDPDRRYTTAREMVVDLERVLPPAPASEVAAWVEHCAHADLTEQAQRVGEMERSDSQSEWSMKAMRSVPELVQPKSVAKETVEAVTRVREDPRSGVSSVSLSHTAPPPSVPASKKKIMIAAAGAFGIGLIIVLAFALGKSSRETAPNSTTSAAPEKTEVKLAATVTPTAPAITATPPSTGAASNVPVIAISALPKATQTQAPPASPKGNDCNPPYTTDAKGHVHFKPQCM
ncbi:MAG TPA: protein kinase, partial [Polyangiaceae bacterium]